MGGGFNTAGTHLPRIGQQEVSRAAAIYIDPKLAWSLFP